MGFGINRASKIKSLLIISLIALLVINSGTTLIYGFNLGYLLPILLVLVLLFDKSYKYFNHHLFYFFVIIFLFITYHHFAFDNSFLTEVMFLARILSVVLIVYFTKKEFVLIFTKMIFFISVISLIFWISMQLFPNLHEILKSIGENIPYYSGSDVFFEIHDFGRTSVHLLLYNLTFDENLISRNCSIFYEPGMFCFYLILSLIFSLFSLGYSVKNKFVYIQIIALLTTFSTSGYIALLILLMYYYLKISKTISNYFILFVVASTISYFVINLDFILQKFITQSQSTEESSRIFAMIYHFDLLEDHYLMGYGFSMPNLLLSPNGISMFMLKYGIILFIFSLFLFIGTFKSLFLKQFQDNFTLLVCLITILIVSFSQTITLMDFYIGIMILGIFTVKKKYSI